MGLKGWHDRGYLPHYDGNAVVQHVVFRLHDALPPNEREGGDHVLDRGYGCSILREPRFARVVASALLHHDRERYALFAWCVMPNHVHGLLETHPDHELGKVVNLWKSYSARRINVMRGARGAVWAADYFDRFIRDEKHFETAKAYIEMNPVAAGLCDEPQDWPFGSAGWSGRGG